MVNGSFRYSQLGGQHTHACCIIAMAVKYLDTQINQRLAIISRPAAFGRGLLCRGGGHVGSSIKTREGSTCAIGAQYRWRSYPGVPAGGASPQLAEGCPSR